MPIIQFRNRTIQCSTGDNLRRVLLNEGLPLYHGVAKVIHCRGMGSCGTCAVGIVGDVTPMTAIERWRLSFPPHVASSGLRLACQCRVEGNLLVSKWPGLWGHRREVNLEKPNAD